ncbi:MAG: aldehyde dehydrogenase family protein, partial [Bacteroidota bacterium]|nr:aldehyde dehydrogenase family protein [Bacteroidota bacterium]
MSSTENPNVSVNQVMQQAAMAFPQYRKTEPEKRALFLEAIATNIEALGEELIQTAAAETHLPVARLQGERGRT